MGYRSNDPVSMTRPKRLLTEFGIHHRLEIWGKNWPLWIFNFFQCLAGICGSLYFRQLWKNLKKQMWMRSESERSRQPASNPPAAQPSVSQPLLQQQPKKVLDQPDTATPTTTATESDPTSKKDDVPVWLFSLLTILTKYCQKCNLLWLVENHSYQRPAPLYLVELM